MEIFAPISVRWQLDVACFSIKEKLGREFLGSEAGIFRGLGTGYSALRPEISGLLGHLD